MDTQARVQDLLKIWSTMQNARTHYEQQWKDIVKWISPERNFWDGSGVDKPGFPAIYDGTPVSALTILANGLQGYIANKNSRSFKVAMESSSMLREKPYAGRLRRYMQELDELFYWMIDRSNFYDAANEMFRIGGSIGTATMYVDNVPDEAELVNIVCDPFEVWIAENEARRVDTVFRRLTMNAKNIIRLFKDGIDDQFIQETQQQPYHEYKILHCVLPRDTRDATKIDNLNKRYASYWILLGRNLMLRESGFDEIPYICWRWSTPHGAAYGWGPSHNAYNTVVMSNQAAKSVTEAAHASVWPALNVPQEMMGKVNLNPKGMNPYMDPNRRIYPVQNVGSYPIGIDRENHLRQAIKEFFFVDFFLALNQSAEYAKRTATEVMEMQAEKAVLLGSITTRIESEFFDPLFDRYFEMAAKNGWLPAPPPELWDIIGQAELKIDYIGPMSQVQQRFYAKQSVDIPLQQIIAYGQVWPEIMMSIDGQKLGKYLVNSSPLPQDLIASDKQIRQSMAQLQAMRQGQAQADTAQKNARAIKDLSQADQDNLSAMAEQMAGGQA